MTTDPIAEQEILLRCRAEARSRGASRPASVDNTRPATVLTPLASHEPPPKLAPDYPETDRPASARWGTSMEMMLPVAAPTDETAQTHRVVDGDTLSALAQRYLGSAARAQELYEANRDVLPDPNLLPIGLDLKLPPRTHRPTPATSDVGSDRSLVPVR